MSNVKNYTEQGGEKTVISGVLEFTDDAVVKNLPKGDGTSWGSYELPIASKTRLGGVKIGYGLGIDSQGCLRPNVERPAECVAESTATTVEELKDKVNELITALKTAGLMHLS